MISVTQLEKSFGATIALAGVSFSIASGEVVGLLGPNGAGKTTSMRIVTGYLAADRGRVEVDGITVVPGELSARRRIGYLPENAPLYHDLEVIAYLEYIARLRGVTAKERTRRVQKMVEQCGLADVVGRPIGQLSKGFRQRVGLAQAMIHEPPILILDEPTSGLDPNQIAEIRRLIRELGHARTVILSTHILQEVEATCSRAVIINRGKVVGEGTLGELMRRGSGATYTITARAAAAQLKEALMKLSGFSIAEWRPTDSDERQRVVLKGENGVDRSEEIFHWAVACHIPLSQLARETASMEDVFRELTQ